MDYQSEDFVSVYRDAPFDLVVDPVGGCRARVAVEEVVTEAAPQQNGTNVTLPDQIVSTTLRTESGDLVPIARSPTALTLRMPAAAAVGPCSWGRRDARNHRE